MPVPWKTLASCVWVVAVLRERCNKDEVHLVFSLLEPPPSWRTLNYHHQYNVHSNIKSFEQLRYHSSISNITQAPQISLEVRVEHPKTEVCSLLWHILIRLHKNWSYCIPSFSLTLTVFKQTNSFFHQLFVIFKFPTGTKKSNTPPQISVSRYAMPDLAE